ncbi:hypothetical protein HPB52_011542 [Rhipicephalus sanguineus]|uniref:Uncharacterized protein n=1 Tax=Rhipicephalus sanguineus TaxID=34632 RepID=A0A9D4QAP2_RHISA|nr:hypothetical protein HPB52_011542 [Rhipicephalus sanguineus]
MFTSLATASKCSQTTSEAPTQVNFNTRGCKEMGTQTDTRTPLEASYLSGPECAQSSPPWRFEPARGSTPVPDTTEEADNGELSSVAPEIDTTYQPSFDESFASDTEPTASPQDESKFLVFRGCLEPLLLKCRICLSTCVNKYMVLGTMLTVESRCKQNHVTSWQSQPMVGAKPAGNVLLAAAILFSGCPIAAVLRCLKYLNMAAITERSFYTYQKCYLLPAVNASAAVPSSASMEKEALVRSLDLLEQLGITIRSLTTGASQAYLKAGCKLETLRACGNDYTPYANGPHLHESGQEFDEGCK